MDESQDHTLVSPDEQHLLACVVAAYYRIDKEEYDFAVADYDAELTLVVRRIARALRVTDVQVVIALEMSGVY